MGEVSRARDTRLDREVAIKVLPAEVSSREDLRQRFEREALWRPAEAISY
jgi:serine/threonine protein kinase